VATQTLILNKTRPNALKTPELDPYFRLLENLLAQVATIGDSNTGNLTIGGSSAYIQAKVDELTAILSDTSARLTTDCASLTVDSDYISVDIS